MKWPTADLGNRNVFVRGVGGVAVSELITSEGGCFRRAAPPLMGPGMFPAGGRAGIAIPRWVLV